jgi:hypothetical protein
LTRPYDTTVPDIRFLQNLAYLVPGYRAYRDASLRRGEDSRLRARLLAAVKELCDDILALHAAWEDQEVEGRWLGMLAEGAKSLRSLGEDIRYVPSQAGAFFLQPSLPTDVIDELLEADLLLLEDLARLCATVSGLPGTPPRRKGMRKLLEGLQCEVQDFAGHLVHRDGVLFRGGAAALPRPAA